MQRRLALLGALLLLTSCGRRPPPTGLDRAKEEMAGGNSFGAFRDAADELSGSRRQQATDFLAANRATLGPGVKTMMAWKIRNQANYADKNYADDLRPAVDNGLLSAADAAELDALVTEKRSANAKAAAATYASADTAGTPRPIHLVVEPNDSAIAAAIKKEMPGLDSRVRFVNAPEKNAVTIKLTRQNWQGQQPPEKQETIDFAWSGPTLRESGSILIDVRISSVALTFAFELTALQSGKRIAGKTVQDTFTEELHVCSNRRFVNVFGVVGPVPRGPFGLYDFGGYPSEAIRVYCSRDDGTPRLSELETRAYRSVAGAIRQLALQ